MIDALSQPARRKAFGAFYTPDAAAAFIGRWAIRQPTDRVIDPSFGGGVFLRAASERLNAIGGDARAQVWGVELDDQAHAHIAQSLAGPHGLDPAKLRCGNFFHVAGSLSNSFDAVIGNPPYIRYQTFAGVDRAAAKRELANSPVKLSELASAWAPFVIRSVALLRAGGRLGMVLPMELFHAGYAKRVLEYLGRSFRTITLVTFDERLFPELSQDTVLVLGDERHDGAAELRVKAVRDVDELDALAFDSHVLHGTKRVPREVLDGRSRLLTHLLPSKARSLYEELRRHLSVVPLATLADVGIGYVSGCNDFFHRAPADARALGVPNHCLRRAVFRGRAFSGSCFDGSAWAAAVNRGDAGHLLAIPARSTPGGVLARLIGDAELAGVHRAYKCRVRTPWYSVPHVHVGDAFLTYMSGVSPALVVNVCGVVAPNTLHVVRMLPLAGCGVWNLAMSWRSSLSQLSAELEGHAMGGGMLKLEPSEAANVSVALPALAEDVARQTCELVDAVASTSSEKAASEAVDRRVLQDVIGLSRKDGQILRETVQWLRDRRYRKLKPRVE